MEYENEGTGFYFEADMVARDLIGGRKENAIVPLEETGQNDRGYG
jgi:dihydrodiol dehydrogenase / D-xylose 1-dehydrogenase (NADP)